MSPGLSWQMRRGAGQGRCSARAAAWIPAFAGITKPHARSLLALLLLRRRIRIVRRLYRVVDHHRHPVLELHRAAGHHLRTRLDTLENRDLIPARRPGRHEHLLSRELWTPLRALLVRRLDHVDGAAVRIV